MAKLDLGPGRSVYYEYDAAPDGKPAFVFINALTGNTGAWQAEIGPALREAGFGTLCWNFRGQVDSEFAAGDTLDEGTITSDLMRLLDELKPSKPVLVGLSIGGLYAANAYLRGAEAAGIVFINSLRMDGLHLSWVNDATARLAKTGGGQLVMDAMMPHIAGPAFLEKMRPNALGDAPYEAMDETSGIYQLMDGARSATWDIAYENIKIPVLNLTGKFDKVFYKPDVVAELLGRMPDTKEVVFEDLGHLIPVEDGKRTAEALIEFGKGL